MLPLMQMLSNETSSGGQTIPSGNTRSFPIFRPSARIASRLPSHSVTFKETSCTGAPLIRTSPLTTPVPKFCVSWAAASNVNRSAEEMICRFPSGLFFVIAPDPVLKSNKTVTEKGTSRNPPGATAAFLTPVFPVLMHGKRGAFCRGGDSTGPFPPPPGGCRKGSPPPPPQAARKNIKTRSQLFLGIVSLSLRNHLGIKTRRVEHRAIEEKNQQKRGAGEIKSGWDRIKSLRRFPCRVHPVVGEADRLGEAVFGLAGEDGFDRAVQRHPMAGRDVDRSDLLLAPQDGADRFAPVDQLNALPSQRTGIVVAAGQQRLAAADGGKIDEVAEVGGDPDPAGMGDSLSVADQAIGQEPEFLPRFQKDRNLPERKEDRNMGKIDFQRIGGHFQNGERLFGFIFQVADDHRGEKAIGMELGRDVDPGHRLDIVGGLIEDQVRSEGVLNFNRLLRAHAPGVKIPIFHRSSHRDYLFFFLV